MTISDEQKYGIEPNTSHVRLFEICMLNSLVYIKMFLDGSIKFRQHAISFSIME